MQKWGFNFYRSSKHGSKQPPKEFLCPISGSLMADPVVVSSGQTFERLAAQICRNLGFSPILDDGSQPDFSAIVPNLAIKSTILVWCNKSGIQPPQIPDYGSLEKLIRSSMASSSSSSRLIQSEPQIRNSEMELLHGVTDNPPVRFIHAVSELNPRVNHLYSNSSSVIVSGTPAVTPLPLETRPECYTFSATSSEIDENEQVNNLSLDYDLKSSEEQDILAKLKSPEVFLQEEAVISLRKITKTKEESRIGLCTPELLADLRPLIMSRYSVVQTNALAALVNLSLEKSNKTEIVRSGIVPFIVDVLKGGFSESQEHAAGALFSLALEDENKTAIGVLGALPPLMHALRSESERTRNDAALALYQLSLVQSNRVKLVKLGAVATLLAMVRTASLTSRVLLILCNLAAFAEGRSAMMDGNAVECLVGMLRRRELETEAARENCVATLFAMSNGSLRFRGLLAEARAAEVMREMEERGSERGREKAKRILEMMRGREEATAATAEVEWDSVFESGGFSRSRVRGGGGGGAAGGVRDLYPTSNSTQF